LEQCTSHIVWDFSGGILEIQFALGAWFDDMFVIQRKVQKYTRIKLWKRCSTKCKIYFKYEI